jgi:hypothetical protein
MAEIEAVLQHPLRINFKPYMSYDAALDYCFEQSENYFARKTDLKISCSVYLSVAFSS